MWVPVRAPADNLKRALIGWLVGGESCSAYLVHVSVSLSAVRAGLRVCRYACVLYTPDSDCGIRRGPAHLDDGRLLWACAAACQKVRLANQTRT